MSEMTGQVLHTASNTYNINVQLVGRPMFILPRNVDSLALARLVKLEASALRSKKMKKPCHSVKMGSRREESTRSQSRVRGDQRLREYN